jgi:hypothetical protein
VGEEPGGHERPDDRAAPVSYVQELHLVLVAVLVVVLIVLLLFGWSRRPRAAALPLTVSNVAFVISGNLGYVHETMTTRGGGTVLELTNSANSRPWSLNVVPSLDEQGNPVSGWQKGWQVCTPRTATTDLVGGHYSRSPYVRTVSSRAKGAVASQSGYAGLPDE